MRLKHVSFVAAVTLFACGDSSVAVDQFKLVKVQTLKHRSPPNNDILHNKGNRRLRIHHDRTGGEERTANNLLDIWDKAWFGVVKNTAANIAGRNENTVINNYPVIQNKYGDFAPLNLANMLRNDAFKENMFKKWDLVTIKTIKLKIGALLNNKKVAAMVVDYVHNHREYGKFKTS
ncbi:RxLR effector protein [Phytophthora megakarya]|uniref:RxLR effector protein n=1 Tax=Phytophthora megakarya TaxID=4795 RepID=A0A225VMD8_9STRA|nr:RxLR effector protein [Phytophthora megakarya]